MVYDYFWRTRSPERLANLRRANEAQAAEIHARLRTGRAVIARLADGLRAAAAAARRRRDRARALRRLEALSDHALRDIGLRRADIRAAAYGRLRDETAQERLAEVIPLALGQGGRETGSGRPAPGSGRRDAA